ncbi:hypothetical protein GGR56DRAFT_362095 [Xylariaceae sp. FL0804]|nr:hypothetical protein GGR56DRAFT_362095 [Xylariaceae sp. FL0804]
MVPSPPIQAPSPGSRAFPRFLAAHHEALYPLGAGILPFLSLHLFLALSGACSLSLYPSLSLSILCAHVSQQPSTSCFRRLHSLTRAAPVILTRPPLLLIRPPVLHPPSPFLPSRDRPCTARPFGPLPASASLPAHLELFETRSPLERHTQKKKKQDWLPGHDVPGVGPDTLPRPCPSVNGKDPGTLDRRRASPGIDVLPSRSVDAG